ncbi:Nicotinamide riboside kinase [Wickerhamomyces ciferrii]|uniref:Nicotinamide riboside kinase n=1 Tax=Wickerhamomyces ciferrii (strain ATCC 14091 / BCRC 22168 / CBS 111 / JCM 3599 / NBRC 0793 / NRRL Y-1031 F-60-10) TaxID=1206466 RepID=K0KFF3_WICCF|nr:Nicotinamide riboside kinase [Wickerhamomyces ciferrii]CCH40957.1 Nicotinamide riboside kinase [Wickerhamomyces ciferrii]
MRERKAVLVAIGGASSSGKTVSYPDNEIPIDEKTGEANWDCPDAINFEAFEKEINYIKQNCQLSPQALSYENRYNSDTKDSGSLSDFSDDFRSQVNHITKYIELENCQLFFIDGFMLFHDPKIINLFDIKLFLRASYKTLKERREGRAGYQTQENFWVDPPNYFDNIVYPAYAESHKFLFIDQNVEQDLNSRISNDLGIRSFANNPPSTLSSVSLWAIETLNLGLQHLKYNLL